VQNKIHEFECWKKEEHKRKIIPSKVDKSFESSDPLSWRTFLRRRKQKFGEKQGSGEIFLRWELSIYRGEGGQFQEVASIRPLWVFRRTLVHSDVPRVMFLPELKSFRGNGSSESTRFPEGLVLGNSGENLTPTECRIYRSSWDKFSGDVRK
jgi:hypothetical protein